MTALFAILLVITLLIAALVLLMGDAFKGFDVKCIYYSLVLLLLIALFLEGLGLYNSLK